MKTSTKKIIKEFKRTNYAKLRKKFRSSLQNTSLLNETDPNVIAQQLTNLTQNAIAKSTTVCKVKIKECFKYCEWISLKTLKLIQRKEKMANRIRKKKKIIRNFKETKQLQNRLKSISRKVKDAMKKDEKKYYVVQCQEKNPRKLWKNLNRILGREKEDSVNAIFDKDGNIMTDDYEIANSLNNNFISSISSILSNNSGNKDKITFEKSDQELSDIEIDESKIGNVIQHLKNSSHGFDNISTKVVKILSDELSPIIAHLIRKIFETETYPTCFKIAVIIPINKSGNKTSLDDYRPVSILTIFNKVIEKVIHKQMYDFVYDKAKIIYTRQYGFRRMCGTESAAFELVDKIRKEIDGKKKVSAVFMDIRKAFDLVNKERLKPRKKRLSHLL